MTIAAADPEQPREDAAGDPDRDEARLEPEDRRGDPGGVRRRLLGRARRAVQWTRH